MFEFTHLYNGTFVSDFTGFLWQEQVFTSQLSLGLWLYLLVIPWAVLFSARQLRSEDREGMPLATNRWIRLLAWFFTW